ncbi:hypothetical protein [Jeotgalibacillus proteolyticus]|uniref:Uncharacterized protein n=1 Tax=Jeotgalibacillus proteolyticus TaxID=2082395 RepID=A0A2S5GAX4_9BACL|nr:hypothetical protein [Jeotgalibacillus proteolyticus]PPA70043.1 hypothetical protein C4B60_10635 [Jeotgalibacillus proteolyticus]
MPYVKNYGKTEEINFLASAKFVAFTEQVSDSDVTANAEGRKVVPAGTVYPANNATAKGILIHDVDVTEGPQPGSIMVEGYVIEARLPEAPSTEAKAAMTEIKYR